MNPNIIFRMASDKKKTQCFDKQAFLSREEKCKELGVPQSTKRCIIVKPNHPCIGYRYDCYLPAFLSPEIDKLRFDQTVQGAHKICLNAYLHKRKEEEMDVFAEKRLWLRISVYLITLAFLLVAICLWWSPSDNIILASTLLIGISGGITGFIVIRSYRVQINFSNIEAIVKERLQEFLDVENSNHYKVLGFEWKMENSSFFWLELHNNNIRNREEEKEKKLKADKYKKNLDSLQANLAFAVQNRGPSSNIYSESSVGTANSEFKFAKSLTRKASPLSRQQESYSEDDDDDDGNEYDDEGYNDQIPTSTRPIQQRQSQDSDEQSGGTQQSSITESQSQSQSQSGSSGYE